MYRLLLIGFAGLFWLSEGCSTSVENDERAVLEVLKTHLGAVSDKNMDALKSTLAPDGQMELLLPSHEVQSGVKFFTDMHEEWFRETGWTYEWKIVSKVVGRDLAFATAEVMYREPDRNGKPYFNKIHVGYGLKKMSGKWYVVKDQACSIEKSEE